MPNTLCYLSRVSIFMTNSRTYALASACYDVKPMRPVLVLLLLLSTACGPRAQPYGSSWTPPARATPEIASLEHQMWDLVNRDRAERGLAPLQWDARLADVGRAHSLDMRQHGFFAHESPNTGNLEDRIHRAGYLALEMRENLASAADIQRAENNLLESPGHYENLMATGVTHLGIGIVPGSASGDPRLITITQVFTRPTYLDSPDKAVLGVAAAIQAARAQRGLAALVVHPLLEQIAHEHVGPLPDDLPRDAIDRVGEAMGHALNDRRDHGLRSMQLSAQAVFNATLYNLPAIAVDARTRAMGIAAAPARDDKGRPRVKVLTIFGH